MFNQRLIEQTLISNGPVFGGQVIPNIAIGEEGANEADQVGMASNIRRALTLVPDEARGFWNIADVQYLSAAQMQDVGGSYRAISRMQIELLASRVSALNQCTY